MPQRHKPRFPAKPQNFYQQLSQSWQMPLAKITYRAKVGRLHAVFRTKCARCSLGTKSSTEGGNVHSCSMFQSRKTFAMRYRNTTTWARYKNCYYSDRFLAYIMVKVPMMGDFPFAHLA
jgi:hypothetical protein